MKHKRERGREREGRKEGGGGGGGGERGREDKRKLTDGWIEREESKKAGKAKGDEKRKQETLEKRR